MSFLKNIRLGKIGLSSLFQAQRPKIGTHDGFFHCDEALAVYLLRQTKAFKDGDVVRSRDPKVLATCNVIVDVGQIYDPQRNLFDHHQKGFEEIFNSNNQIKLSSAGLIYKHFGQEILARELNLSQDHPTVTEIYNKIYSSFIKSLDAKDNGIMPFETEESPRYTDSTDLGTRISRLHPAWNEPNDSEIVNERFEEASSLAGKEFKQSVRSLIDSWLPAREIVQNAYKNRMEAHPSGRVVVLEKSCPWKNHLTECEGDSATEVLYVISQTNDGMWMVQSVGKPGLRFKNKWSLPQSWRGLGKEELREVSGIPGASFVHAAGFIGGANSRQDALNMASKAIEEFEASKKNVL
ncbi:metal-dependent protein hydrolase [Phycomyces nitens]|nr:metal-dependent protein hydrolase [Phycomyces nitens]